MSTSGINTAQYLNKYSTRAVSNFLQPHSSLDRAYLIFLTFWFCTSLFIQQNPLLRLGTFVGTIFFLFLSNFDKKRGAKEISFLGSTIKLFIISLLIGFFTGDAQVTVDITLPFDLTYLGFEGFILVCCFLFAIFFNSFNVTLLTKYGFKGYQAFIKSLMRGFWLIGIGLYLLIEFKVLKATTPIFPEIWEEYIFYVLIIYLGTSFLPYSYNSLTNSLSRRNPIVNFRDSALGASLTLLVLEFLFHNFTDSMWSSLIPFLLITSIILFVIRDEEIPYFNQVLAKSLSKSKEMRKILNESTFQEVENGFIIEKPTNLLKKSSTLLAEKDSLIVPLSFSDDFVTLEAIGDISINLKDAIGRLKTDSTDKLTFMLPIKEWESLSKKMKKRKLSELKLPKFSSNFADYNDLKDNLEASFTSYKNKLQNEGLVKVEENYELVKSKFGMNVSDKRTEFNFPGIKVIDEPGSQLFKFGSIEVIDVKRELPDNTEAKYMSMKMPFISVTDIDCNGKFLVLNMPFVSALETPKGLILKLAGFDVTEGNKHAILEDLNRIMDIQAKFNDYFNFRMSNVFASEDNPNLIVTQDFDDKEPKLLVAGEEDSFFLDEEQPYAIPPTVDSSKSLPEPEGDYIEIPESEIEIVEEVLEEPAIIDMSKNLNEKLTKIMKRFDKMPKEDFKEYMGFQTNKEFLNWLTSLPDDVPIRVEDDIVWFK